MSIVFQAQAAFGWRALLDFLPPGASGESSRPGPQGVETLGGVEFLRYSNAAERSGAPPIIVTPGSDVIRIPDSTEAQAIPGSAGDDFYFWSGAGPITGAAQDDGVDTLLVQASISLSAFPAIENLIATWRPAVVAAPIYPTSGFWFGQWLPTAPAGFAPTTSALSLTGNGLDNLIVGAAGSDTLRGEDGHDRLIGLDGSDRIEGGSGNDWLDGGLGNDVLNGGAGRDTFSITYFGSRWTPPGMDVIEDFNPAEDTIYFDGWTIPGAFWHLYDQTSTQFVTWAQVGADAVMSYLGGSVTLRNVSLSQISAANVVYGPSSFGHSDGGRVQFDVRSTELGARMESGFDLWDYLGLDGINHPDTRIYRFTETPGAVELEMFVFVESQPSQVTFFRDPATGYVTGIRADNFNAVNLGQLRLTVDDIINDPSRLFTNGVDFRGSTNANQVRSGDGNDRLVGGWNNDRLDAGRGDAFIDGKDGTDWARLDFSNRTQGLVYQHNATEAFALVGGVRVAQLLSIERVEIIGTAYDDEVVGGALDDLIDMYRGGGRADGGAGDDLVRADFSDRTTGLTFNLSSNATVNAGAQVLLEVRNAERISLIGGAGADQFTGGDAADTFDGGGGNDLLVGGGGDDTFWLSGGNDDLRGGDGLDTLRYDGTLGLTIDLGATGAQTTALGSLTLSSVENARLMGTGAMTITGSSDANIIYTGSGDDWISSGDGNDRIMSGDGGGYINAGSGHDVVYAGTEILSDIRFSAADHEIWLGAGDDQVFTGVGDDIVYGEAGDDDFTGYGGNNVFYGGDGTDFGNFGDGDDWADLGDGEGRQVFLGGGGDDYARVGSGGYAAMAGAAGDDELHGGDGDDRLIGDDVYDVWDLQGADRLFGYGGSDRIEGHGGDDWINGGEGYDYLYGYSGFDIVDYEGHSTGVTVDLGYPVRDGHPDYLESFEGLNGSAFADHVTGTWGTNRLMGQGGDDTLIGLRGDDVLEGGAGNDRLDGGEGLDIALFSGVRSAYTVTREGDEIVVVGPDGTDRLTGVDILQFADRAESANGGAVLAGTDRGDVLTGTSVSETLWGVGGDDTLNGGGGDDILVGGEGVDVLTGGTGADVFLFDYRIDSFTSTPDTITDFQTGVDRIVLNDPVWNTMIRYIGENSYIFSDPFFVADPWNPQPPAWGYRWEYGGRLEYAQMIVVRGHVAADDVVRTTGTLYLYGDDTGQTINGGRERVLIDGLGGNDRITSQGGDDELWGGSGNDVLSSGAGSDVLWGGSGDDFVDGGTGEDIAMFSGYRSQYQVFSLNGQIVVKGFEGKDVLVNVELLRFLDGDYDPTLIVCFEPDLPGAAAKDGAPLVLPGSSVPGPDNAGSSDVFDPPIGGDDPQILPAGLEGKAQPDDGPVICLPVDVEVGGDVMRPVDLSRFDIDLPDLALLPGERGRPATVAQDYDWIV